MKTCSPDAHPEERCAFAGGKTASGRVPYPYVWMDTTEDAPHPAARSARRFACGAIVLQRSIRVMSSRPILSRRRGGEPLRVLTPGSS